MFSIRFFERSRQRNELARLARVLIRRANVRLSRGRSPIYVAVEMQWSASQLGCERELLAELDEMEREGE